MMGVMEQFVGKTIARYVLRANPVSNHIQSVLILFKNGEGIEIRSASGKTIWIRKLLPQEIHDVFIEPYN